MFAERVDVDRPELSDDDSRHLARVLRLRAGELVTVGDGHGAWRTCRFTGRAGALLEAGGDVVVEPRAEPPVTVGLTVVKGERVDWAVQKLTEVGVDRVLLLEARRSVVRWDGTKAERNLARLRRIAREAAMQSRRAWLPEVEGVLSLDQAKARSAPVVLAQPGGGHLAGPPTAVLVGPEGGWDPTELDGATTVSLGPTVLRTETAGVAAGVLLCAFRTGTVRPYEHPA